MENINKLKLTARNLNDLKKAVCTAVESEYEQIAYFQFELKLSKKNIDKKWWKNSIRDSKNKITRYNNLYAKVGELL